MPKKSLYLARASVTFLALGLAQGLFAQVSTTTPGVPSTALGGNALLNIFVLVFSMSLIVVGVVVAKYNKNIS